MGKIFMFSSRYTVCGTRGEGDGGGNAGPAGIRYQEKETGYNRVRTPYSPSHNANLCGHILAKRFSVTGVVCLPVAAAHLFRGVALSLAGPTGVLTLRRCRCRIRPRGSRG